MATGETRIHGSGIVAKALALAWARQGLASVLDAAPADRPADVRGLALNHASVDLLRQLKVWGALPATALTSVHDMRVFGDAPGAELRFSAWRLQLAELAWIVDADALERALHQAVGFSPHIRRLSSAADAVEAPAASSSSAMSPPYALVVGCDGNASALRATLGVDWQRDDTGQTAVAARLVSSQDHGQVARQWFRSPDVLALLPFDTVAPGRGLALVWSLPRSEAEAAMAMDGPAFGQALNDATRGAAGQLQLQSERGTWPLVSALATPWCGPGWVLLGDAAHSVHPLAGQGLNLGLGDVASLAAVVATREPWRAIGDERLLRRYVRERRPAAQAMRLATDGLLRLYAHGAPAVRELRHRGLGLVNSWSPGKRWLTGRALRS